MKLTMGVFINRTKCFWALLVVILTEIRCDDDDFNVLHRDGSYEFGYKTPDSYHYADANRQNVVRGEFGARNPSTGGIDSTVYTAGPRGFRPRGKNIVRKYDLNQNGPRPVGSRDDPFYDPLEDPSYSFSFRTRTYTRQENANRIGDVNGKYSYLDDAGERHNVEFIAGKKTGFHVKTPFPDSNPRAYGPLYYNGRGKPIPRGRTSIQRGLDGSYRFVSAGPDQRRTEISDPSGHVRGSYTYLDDKGVQHSVHYIAGPEIGYRVLKNVKGPHLPTIYPFGYPNILPPDFYDSYKDDIFDTNNKPYKPSPIGGDNKKPSSSNNPDSTGGDFNSGSSNKPNYNDEDGDFSGDLFGGNPPLPPQKPSDKAPNSYHDDGQYRPSGDDGQYRPNPPDFNDISKPSISTSGNSVDYGLFDGNGNTVNEGRPTIQITGQNNNCERCKGTLVTNVGDKTFSVAPGVSVRAHVQSIDLLPLASQVPSPSEQFNAEMNLNTEQLNEASAGVDNRFDNNDKTTETTTVNTPESVTTATTTTTTTTATETVMTTEKVDTTTSVPVTTTTIKTTTTTRRNRDDEDDLDIF